MQREEESERRKAVRDGEVSERKPKYPLLRKLGNCCREMDERDDGGYLVGGPAFELDVRGKRERESKRWKEGAIEASQSRSVRSSAD